MKPSNVGSNYSVFLETLNRAQRATDVTAPTEAARPAETGTRPLDIVAVLARHTGPVAVVDLAKEAEVKVTPLVLALQRLKEAGMVEVHTETDEAELTELGRQMLKVGQLLESQVGAER